MISWWKRTLDGRPRGDIPLVKRRKRASGLDWREGLFDAPVGSDEAGLLDDIARHHHATEFQIGVAIFVAVLAARAGRPDIVLATYASNRKRPELQDMFGDFTNLVTLRFRCDLAKTFRSWIVEVRDSIVEALAYSELPYDELHRAFRREFRRMPKLSAICHFRRPLVPLRFAGLEIVDEQVAAGAMVWGANFGMYDGNYSARFNVDAHIYDPADVRRLAEQWSRLAGLAARNPDAPLRQLCGRADIRVVRPARWWHPIGFRRAR
jgi:hypothetical protein